MLCNCKAESAAAFYFENAGRFHMHIRKEVYWGFLLEEGRLILIATENEMDGQLPLESMCTLESIDASTST